MINDPEQMRVLLAGGFFGTLTKLLLRPEKSWRSWLAQFVVGISCAVFLGGLVGRWLDAGPAGFAAVAYVFGSAAEQALAVAQSKLGKPK